MIGKGIRIRIRSSSQSMFVRMRPLQDADIACYRFVCSINLGSVSAMERCFPNAHAIITLAKPRGKRAPIWKKVHFGAEDSPFAARVRLYRPIRSDTLSSLFRYPAAWGYSRPHEIHLIEAISSIDLIGDAALLQGHLKPSDLLRRNWSERCHLSTRDCNRYDLIEESTREMLRLAPKLPVRDSDDFSPPVLAMYVKPGQGLDACLHSVSLVSWPDEATTHIFIT
jgi:hypothetical protein